ncbi:MAG: hypothetical protein N2201_04090 [candidate division WOR-3 bacterium]|nr:hypothetical protein [candidate division WOR-3 bacterium]
MAQKKNQQFRVAKINILKSVARRPKGFLRVTKIHKDKTIYSRKKEKQIFKKEITNLITNED